MVSVLDFEQILLLKSYLDLRKTIELEDNLFLDRYAESVTMNGQQINAPNATEMGYGIWRLTQRDIEKLIAKPAQNTGFVFKYYF